MDACDQLLVVLVVHLLRGPRRPLDGTVENVQLLLNQLRIHYLDAGTPYGEDERGFQRWLLDCWPAPLMV